MFQVEDGEHHLLVAMRDHAAGFVHDGTQFVAGEVQLLAAFGGYAEQAQDAVGDAVDSPDQRIEQLQQRLQDIGGREGHCFRV